AARRRRRRLVRDGVLGDRDPLDVEHVREVLLDVHLARRRRDARVGDEREDGVAAEVHVELVDADEVGGLVAAGEAEGGGGEGQGEDEGAGTTRERELRHGGPGWGTGMEPTIRPPRRRAPGERYDQASPQGAQPLSA